jgi:hypothetical protein
MLKQMIADEDVAVHRQGESICRIIELQRERVRLAEQRGVRQRARVDRLNIDSHEISAGHTRDAERCRRCTQKYTAFRGVIHW